MAQLASVDFSGKGSKIVIDFCPKVGLPSQFSLSLACFGCASSESSTICSSWLVPLLPS